MEGFTEGGKGELPVRGMMCVWTSVNVGFVQANEGQLNATELQLYSTKVSRRRPNKAQSVGSVVDNNGSIQD